MVASDVKKWERDWTRSWQFTVSSASVRRHTCGVWCNAMPLHARTDHVDDKGRCHNHVINSSCLAATCTHLQPLLTRSWEQAEQGVGNQMIALSFPVLSFCQLWEYGSFSSLKLSLLRVGRRSRRSRRMWPAFLRCVFFLFPKYRSIRRCESSGEARPLETDVWSWLRKVPDM